MSCETHFAVASRRVAYGDGQFLKVGIQRVYCHTRTILEGRKHWISSLEWSPSTCCSQDRASADDSPLGTALLVLNHLARFLNTRGK